MSQKPDDSYLVKIGTLAYQVADIEWLMLGDLESFRAVIPADLTAERLSGMTTYDIANKVRAGAATATNSDVAAYLTGGADALDELVGKRNAVFHARPASFDGQNRLRRWVKKTNKEGVTTLNESFYVTDRWLDDIIKRADELLDELKPLRTTAHQRHPL